MGGNQRWYRRRELWVAALRGSDKHARPTGNLYYLAYGGGALYRITSPLANSAFVDLALYRPSTGQLFIRSGLNGSVTAIAFGAPGDRGLLCKYGSNTI